MEQSGTGRHEEEKEGNLDHRGQRKRVCGHEFQPLSGASLKHFPTARQELPVPNEIMTLQLPVHDSLTHHEQLHIGLVLSHHIVCDHHLAVVHAAVPPLQLSDAQVGL